MVSLFHEIIIRPTTEKVKKRFCDDRFSGRRSTEPEAAAIHIQSVRNASRLEIIVWIKPAFHIEARQKFAVLHGKACAVIDQMRNKPRLPHRLAERQLPGKITRADLLTFPAFFRIVVRELGPLRVDIIVKQKPDF